MTKTRSTKRALLMSALALLVCISMLVGSTFAGPIAPNYVEKADGKSQFNNCIFTVGSASKLTIK